MLVVVSVGAKRQLSKVSVSGEKCLGSFVTGCDTCLLVALKFTEETFRRHS